MTARNDITGDAITNSKGDANKYRNNFDKIDWSVKMEVKPTDKTEDKKDKE